MASRVVSREHILVFVGVSEGFLCVHFSPLYGNFVLYSLQDTHSLLCLFCHAPQMMLRG